MQSRSLREKLALLGLLVAFAGNSIACGQISVPMTLALDSEASSISLELLPAGTPLGTTVLEGGVDTNMEIDINLFDILFFQPLSGGIEIVDLLFAGTELSILGIPTGTLCTIVDESAPGGGTAIIDIFAGEISFNMDLATVILPTDPGLLSLIPDGFAFPTSFSDTAELSLIDLLGLAFGNADGGLTITQPLDTVISVEVLGLPLDLGISGEITLATANEFPTGPLLDQCDDFLDPPPLGIANADMEDGSDVFDDGLAWEQDAFSIVGSENGITPEAGGSMLRFDATDGASASAQASATVSQEVDVTDYAQLIATGTATFNASAYFNRIAGDAGTDTQFSIILLALDAGGAVVGSTFSPGFTDADTGTWELHQTSVLLTLDTKSVEVLLSGVEDIENDLVAPELDGHYADSAEVWISP